MCGNGYKDDLILYSKNKTHTANSVSIKITVNTDEN